MRIRHAFQTFAVERDVASWWCPRNAEEDGVRRKPSVCGQLREVPLCIDPVCRTGLAEMVGSMTIAAGCAPGLGDLFGDEVQF